MFVQEHAAQLGEPVRRVFELVEDDRPLVDREQSSSPMFKQSGDNERRLVVMSDKAHSLRGFFYRDEDADVTVVVVQQFGRSGEGNSTLMVLTAHVWPGAYVAAHVTRPWKRGSDYGLAWSEMRRQVKASVGVDVGDVPRRNEYVDFETAKALVTDLLKGKGWVSSNYIHEVLREQLAEGMFGRVKTALHIPDRQVTNAENKREYQWRA